MKPRKLKIDRVKIRKEILKEYSEGNYKKLDKLCTGLDEFRYNWEDGGYKSSPSFESIGLYVLHLESTINILYASLTEKEQLIEKLLLETSEWDETHIGDV